MNRDKVIRAQAVVDQMDAGFEEGLRETPHGILLAILAIPPGIDSASRVELIRAIASDDFVMCCVMVTVIRELQRRAMEIINDD